MVEIIQDFIPPGRRNRPGLKLRGPEYVTIHDTANPKRGADALAHASYWKGAAANVPSSVHFTVDDQRIVQSLPLDEVAWHAGDGADGQGNRSSIAIEICENADGDRRRAERNAAELVADLLRRFNLGVDRVVQHNHWSGKNCPHILRSRPGGWQGFLDMVREYMADQPGTPIVGPASATVAQALAWAKARGAAPVFLEYLPLYWQIWPEYGLDPAVGAAQSAKETAFGRFSGAVTPDQHNPCGLKVTRPTGDRREDHATFPDWATGVRAHGQHLALYAGVDVAGPIVDPRHFPSIRGTAKTVEALGGRWAPSEDYGRSIVADYLVPLQRTTAPAPETNEVEQLQARLAAAEARAAAAEGKLAKVREIVNS